MAALIAKIGATGVQVGGKQAGRHVAKQAGKQAGKQASKQASKQTGKQAGKQASKQTGKQAKQQGQKAIKNQGQKMAKKQGQNTKKEAAKKLMGKMEKTNELYETLNEDEGMSEISLPSDEPSTEGETTATEEMSDETVESLKSKELDEDKEDIWTEEDTPISPKKISEKEHISVSQDKKSKKESKQEKETVSSKKDEKLHKKQAKDEQTSVKKAEQLKKEKLDKKELNEVEEKKEKLKEKREAKQSKSEEKKAKESKKNKFLIGKPKSKTRKESESTDEITEEKDVYDFDDVYHGKGKKNPKRDNFHKKHNKYKPVNYDLDSSRSSCSSGYKRFLTTVYNCLKRGSKAESSRLTWKLVSYLKRGKKDFYTNPVPMENDQLEILMDRTTSCWCNNAFNPMTCYNQGGCRNYGLYNFCDYF